MRKIVFAIILLMALNQSNAQYKYDNKLFRTIYWDQLCQELQKKDGHLLLDVRSEGEFEDTSTYVSLNMGRLKGATNISIHDLPAKINELDAYKDKPIFVYCSHSQRSRRASRLLSEKGFKNVININGGMSMFNNLKNSGIICQQSIFETNIHYGLLSPADVCSLLAHDPNVFILDTRKDSAFNGIAADEQENAYGTLRQSVNIPMMTLEKSFDKIPADKSILIIDSYGNESPKAAKLLLDKGYKNINILFDGMDNWAGADPSSMACKNQLWMRNSAYQLLAPEEFNTMLTKNTDLLIIDIRGDTAFNNQAKDGWRNVGQIKQAVNIPSNELEGRLDQISQFKNKPVIVYGFSSSTEAFSSARLLAEKGFTQVSVLMGGIFNLRWKAANIKDHAYLNKWVVNIPEANN